MRYLYNYFPCNRFERVVFKIKNRLIKFFQYIFSYIAGGNECVCCQNMSFLIPICKSCRAKYLNFVTKPINRCKICGRELISEIETCLECREKPLLLKTDGVFPLFSYRLWNKKLLFNWKLLDERTLSPFFALLIHKGILRLQIDLEKQNKSIDVLPIVPVPPRPNKIKKRGWDQIDELCHFLSGEYNHIILPLLVRNSQEQQKKRDRHDRLEKIHEAYSLKDKNEINKIIKKQIPKSVILLDDVMTTGATVERCAELLKQVGIEKVYVLTLFIVD